MSDNFFPEDYVPPASAGNYLKLGKDSGARIRVISDHPALGFEAWTKDNKPVRWRTKPAILPAEIRIEENGTQQVKDFTAMVVWNYDVARFQIWQVTQATVRDALFALSKHKDYGHLSRYDLEITRSDKKGVTKYSVLPLPILHVNGKPALDMAAAQVAAAHINLNALFDGTNPFEETTPTATAPPAPTATSLPPGAKAPAELIAYLRQGAQRYESDPPLPDGWYGSLKGHLERIVGGINERHTFTQWAFGAVSGDELSNGAWIMLKNWLKITKAADNKYYPDGVAKAEAEAAMAFIANRQTAIAATEDMDEEIPF